MGGCKRNVAGTVKVEGKLMKEKFNSENIVKSKTVINSTLKIFKFFV